jgi:hypothetical protein
MDKTIEYRSSRGRRLEVAGQGLLREASDAVNLRSMGCPEWIVERVERGAIERRAAAAMAKGTTPASSATDADRRARAAELGQQIAADNERIRKDSELKTRMKIAAGIYHA